MHHAVRRRCTVPVADGRRNVDGIAGTDFDRFFALLADQANAMRDIESLTKRMGMPSGSGTRLECDASPPGHAPVPADRQSDPAIPCR